MLNSALYRSFSSGPRIQYIGGSKNVVSDSRDVELRGIRIQGNGEDLPSLIFFPDVFDQVENWLPYFTSPQNQILDYRNVYLLYPRNFGLSDWCTDTPDEYGEAVAKDVERFMYQNKITMATLGGHGFGAKNAMVTATYKSELVTGVMAYDYAPQDYTYFRSADTLRNISKSLAEFEDKPFSRAAFEKILDKEVQCPKLRAVLQQNLRQVGLNDFTLNFNNKIVSEQFEELVNWKKIQYGLYGGRVCFIFPEYSNYVFLNSNTLSMMKVAVKTQGYMHDIQSIMTESDNPEKNHWIYEDPQMAKDFGFQTMRFLSQYDGVHVQLMNKAELLDGPGIPVRGALERKDRYSGNIMPQHYHHNWRFSDRDDLK